VIELLLEDGLRMYLEGAFDKMGQRMDGLGIHTPDPLQVCHLGECH
jgi:hypothetical protein